MRATTNLIAPQAMNGGGGGAKVQTLIRNKNTHTHKTITIQQEQYGMCMVFCLRVILR